MQESLFEQLPLAEKADFIKEKGQFIEGQDFYSFFILVYLLNKRQVKLLYDFSGLLVAIEMQDSPMKENFITAQFEASLDTLD